MRAARVLSRFQIPVQPGRVALNNTHPVAFTITFRAFTTHGNHEWYLTVGYNWPYIWLSGQAKYNNSPVTAGNAAVYYM